MPNMEIKTHSYNQRRYGRPWIARVDFSQDPKGSFAWGSWIGDARNGSDGILIIDAPEGAIVAYGQKDFRQPQNSAPTWCRVRGDQLAILSGKAEAYKLSQSPTPPEQSYPDPSGEVANA